MELPNKIARKCKICKKRFVPNKYHPRQKVCLKPECQRIRNQILLKKWYMENPDYFKEWRSEYYHQKSKEWRKKHSAYFREYWNSHPEWREKRRLYMQIYRKKHNVL